MTDRTDAVHVESAGYPGFHDDGREEVLGHCDHGCVDVTVHWLVAFRVLLEPLKCFWICVAEKVVGSNWDDEACLFAEINHRLYFSRAEQDSGVHIDQCLSFVHIFEHILECKGLVRKSDK